MRSRLKQGLMRCGCESSSLTALRLTFYPGYVIAKLLHPTFYRIDLIANLALALHLTF
jgi:hypothetical protein